MFVWNIEYKEEVRKFIKLDGQIVGNKTTKWDKNCLEKLDDFKSCCKENNITIDEYFWS